MTAKEQLAYIGQQGRVLTGVGSISIPVQVKDVRIIFGRVDLLLEPVNGWGEAWVDLNRVTLLKGKVEPC